jgi:hypothetical protein
MNKKLPWKQAYLTGLIVAIFSLSCFSIVDHFNKKMGWEFNPMTIRGITGIVSLLILGIGIFAGMQRIKRQQHGMLTYKQAILAGILIALICGIITALFSFIYCQLINPHFAADMLAESRKLMIAQGVAESQVAINLAEIHKQLTTPILVMQALLGQSLAGTIISLVMALFIKTKK